MNETQQHAREALSVLQKANDQGLPASYHGLLEPHLSGLLGLFLTIGDDWDQEQQASMNEVARVCNWDRSAYQLLRVPGVKWPPPASVNPDLAYMPDLCDRLRVALEGLAGEPDTDDNGGISPDSNLSAKALANHFGISHEALRQRLNRFRKKAFDGWMEVTEPKPNEPRYLYRVGAVQHIVDSLR